MDENAAYWKQELEKLQRMFAQTEAEINQIYQNNIALHQQNEKLEISLSNEKVKSTIMEERLDSHLQMTKMTTNYLTQLSEDEKHQRQVIEEKNQELEVKQQELEKQKKASDKLYTELQASHDEMKMQKDYLEATMKEIQASNEEIEMQKTYLQSMVEDLARSHDEIEKQKASLEVTVKALENSNDEIEKQKANLEVTIKALEQSNVEIETQKTLLEQAFEELDAAYGDITSSITYAKRIQDAMLPKPSLLELYFEDVLVFFKPRDIVSGDFYWFTQEQNKFIIVAADCTGHGVPGALMSMLGINLLNEIVSNNKNTSPEKILSLLDLGINYTLDQEKTKNSDGMDIAICTIDLTNQVLEYAGAHNPMLLIQNNELQVIGADRLGVGGFDKKQKSVYNKHTFQLDQPTTIYIYSDGYQDQFGGKARRKFMSKTFKKFLFDIHDKSMQEQNNILDTTLEDWKDGQPQIDDILVLGLKIS